jgi:hypothetical protein
MKTYERPTLTMAGSFKKVTGLGGTGPRDTLGRHQSL